MMVWEKGGVFGSVVVVGGEQDEWMVSRWKKRPGTGMCVWPNVSVFYETTCHHLPAWCKVKWAGQFHMVTRPHLRCLLGGLSAFFFFFFAFFDAQKGYSAQKRWSTNVGGSMSVEAVHSQGNMRISMNVPELSQGQFWDAFYVVSQAASSGTEPQWSMVVTSSAMPLCIGVPSFHHPLLLLPENGLHNKLLEPKILLKTLLLENSKIIQPDLQKWGSVPETYIQNGWSLVTFSS